jgi:hypothetical protein
VACRVLPVIGGDGVTPAVDRVPAPADGLDAVSAGEGDGFERRPFAAGSGCPCIPGNGCPGC